MVIMFAQDFVGFVPAMNPARATPLFPQFILKLNETMRSYRGNHLDLFFSLYSWSTISIGA